MMMITFDVARAKQGVSAAAGTLDTFDPACTDTVCVHTNEMTWEYSAPQLARHKLHYRS